VNISYRGGRYRVMTEAELLGLLFALAMLDAFARRKAA
jgi:hypothetical protein